MNFMKRAFLYVSRKRGKSILLFFILLILSTFVLTGLSIGSASKQAQKNLRQVKHFPDYEENVYNIYANDEVYKNTAISLENLDKLVIGLLLVIIIAK